MDEIRMGVYRHYKGEHYLVIGIAHDANADDLMSSRELGRHLDAYKAKDGESQTYPLPLGTRTVVVYVPLYLAKGPRMAVRTLEDFLGWVHSDARNGCRKPPWSTCTDSLHESGHRVRRRFTYVGES